MNLVKKKGFRNRMKQVRPIAVIPVLYKVYSTVILMLTDGRLEKLVAPQYAFRKQYQAHEVIFILRMLVEKALEWNIPVFRFRWGFVQGLRPYETRPKHRGTQAEGSVSGAHCGVAARMETSRISFCLE